MSIDFSKFDKAVDTKAIEEAKANPPKGKDTPAGEYIAKFEKLELTETKDHRPMVKVQLRVVEAGESASDEVIEYLSHFKDKKPCLFMNRVIYGTKNDPAMIASILGWLDTLQTETLPEFISYSQFADNLLDIFEEVADTVELAVSYDPDAFNSIEVNEVFDV